MIFRLITCQQLYERCIFYTATRRKEDILENTTNMMHLKLAEITGHKLEKIGFKNMFP